MVVCSANPSPGNVMGLSGAYWIDSLTKSMNLRRDSVSKIEGTGSRGRTSRFHRHVHLHVNVCLTPTSQPPIQTLMLLGTASPCDDLGGQVSHCLPDNSAQLLLLHRTCAGGGVGRSFWFLSPVFFYKIAFQTGSHYTAQVGSKFNILMPRPPEHCAHSCGSSCLTRACGFS